MRISELIAELQKQKAEHGDLEVWTQDRDQHTYYPTPILEISDVFPEPPTITARLILR